MRCFPYRKIVQTFSASILCFGLVLTSLFVSSLSNAGSAIFLHPDGMGAEVWSALRLQKVGPDGRLAWDQLPATAIYIGPMRDSVNASSNGGATTHAYGIRASLNSYGSVSSGGTRPKALSGKTMSLMHEAMAAGKRVGLINSASLSEPGTGAFLASVRNRDDEQEIVAQMLAAKPDLMLGGGEQFFLPIGTTGKHGPGVRNDQRNLVLEARKLGYQVIYTRAELLSIDPATPKVLGLFAAEHTFNEGTEAQLTKRKLPIFQPQAPRYDDMVDFALKHLSAGDGEFLLVANEEGTDNLSGDNHALATLEAAAGAERAIAIVQSFLAKSPTSTLIVASDSVNGALNATSDDLDELKGRLPKRSANGSPIDSDNGKAFLSASDARGNRIPFYFVWASDSDMAGATVARAAGPGARLVQGSIDSTDIYRALYLGLFGTELTPSSTQP
jgi:alkaline phosphatase